MLKMAANQHYVEKVKCKSIIYQLLHLLTLDRDPPKASVFIRELQQISRCDNVQETSQLKLVRDSYNHHLGGETLERVMKYKQTLEDEERCVQVLKQKHVWTASQLRSQLPYTTQFIHWGKTNAESSLYVLLGLISTGLVSSSSSSSSSPRGYPLMIIKSQEWINNNNNNNSHMNDDDDDGSFHCLQ